MKSLFLKHKKITVAAIAVLAIAAIAIVCLALFGKGSGKAKRTIMVYMVASNLETKGGSASSDLQEMIDSGVDLKKTNIIVYAGGTTEWKNEFSTEGTNYYCLTATGDDKPVFKKVNQKTPTVNMADAPALSDFVNFCTQNYPADRYGLIFWDHGEGPNIGFGKDIIYFDSDSPNYLTLKESEEEMKKTIFSSENKLEFVGYDACLMASLEVANAWADYADYMIASEETEPGDGWCYSFLSELNRSIDTKDFCNAVSQSYVDYYAAQSNEFFNPELTIAVLDLSKAQQVTDCTVNLINAMKDKVDAGDEVATKAQINGVKKFGARGNGGCGLVDLGSYADTVSQYYADEVTALHAAIDEMVVSHQFANVEGTCGVSLYDPLYDTTSSNEYNDGDGNLDYGEALHAIRKKLELKTQESDVSWDFADVQTGDTCATLQLTPEQLDNAAKITYMIYTDVQFGAGDNVYSPVNAMTKAQIASDGTVSVPLDPTVIVAQTKFGEAVSDTQVIGVVQKESGTTRSTYTTLFTYLFNSDYSLGTSKRARANISMSVMADGSVTVNEATGNELDLDGQTGEPLNNLSVSGKATVNVKDWTELNYIYAGKYYDEKNPGVFFDDWKRWEGASWHQLCIVDGLQFLSMKTTEVPADYTFTAQIIVEDFSGNYHASKMFSLKNKYDAGITKEVVKDDIRYDVYEDHAELRGYNGKAKTVTVPASVNGVPVTKIRGFADEEYRVNTTVEQIVLPQSIRIFGNGAFDDARALKKINIPSGVNAIPTDCFAGKFDKLELPDTVKYIAPFAFRTSEIKQLDLPKGIEYLSYGALSVNFGNIDAVTFGGTDKGKHYQVKDHMVLTADGKTLICGYVAEGAETIRIPDGVEVIEKFAFQGKIKRVGLGDDPRGEGFVHTLILPEGLKEIGDRAFDCLCTLTQIDLPESLEKIGVGAFSAGLTNTDPLFIDTLRIPKNLTNIQEYAFDSYKIKKFEVEEGNAKFKAVNGRLTYKSGEKEIIVSQPLTYFYDIKGNAYETSAEVLYYDAKGKAYRPGGMFGSQLEDVETGEAPDGSGYLNADGYVVILPYDKTNLLARGVYQHGTIEFECNSVEWTAKGKLTAYTYGEKTAFYDRNGKKYGSITEVPYYTKGGKIYYPIDDDGDNFIDGFADAGGKKVIEYSTSVRISADGYLIEKPTYSYVSVNAVPNGKYYFSPSAITWDATGNMLYYEKEIIK